MHLPKASISPMWTVWKQVGVHSNQPDKECIAMAAYSNCLSVSFPFLHNDMTEMD